MITSDPYDVEVIKAYRAVFFETHDGPVVLDDILSSLAHFATGPLPGMSAEVQLALEHQAKSILDKLGIFRYNNLDGYTQMLKNVPPRYYQVEKEE